VVLEKKPNVASSIALPAAETGHTATTTSGFVRCCAT
jgi:hypothetical protein